MISSVIPARLEFSCGHVALVSLPRPKGESPTQRTARVNQEKTEARGRACDFCGPREQALLEVRPVQDAVPSGELNGHHAGDEKENLMHSAETPSVTRLGAEETRRTFPPRRRLNEEQEREVTRLYAETTMPVPEISKQFSIGESSVYRIAQRHGAGLRGRIAAPATPPTAAPKAPRVSRRAKAAAPVAPVATPPTNGRRRPRAATAQATATPTRRRSAPAVVTRRAALRAVVTPAVKRTRSVRQPAAPVAGGALLRFEIRFHAETVLQAADVRAALRQVESLGATDVIAIVRQDR
jgi:transposase-like protein